jgi:hypothetical protein
MHQEKRRLYMAKGSSAVEIAPIGWCGVVLDRHERQFKGRTLVNLGDYEDCKITNLFVGCHRVTPPGFSINEEYAIPLASMVWPLPLCAAGVDITVMLRNDSDQPRKVLFMFEGDDQPDLGEADEYGWIEYEKNWRKFATDGRALPGTEVEIDGYHRPGDVYEKRCYLIGDINTDRGGAHPDIVGLCFSDQAIVTRYRILVQR